jgi:hypothetical protein
MLTLNIQGEPVAWSVPLVLRSGVCVKKPKLRNWQTEIRKQVTGRDEEGRKILPSQLPNGFERWEGCPLLVRRFIVRRTRAKSNKSAWPVVRPDLDNFEKAFFDAIEGIVYKDDSQIVYILSAQKIWATQDKPPGIEAQFEAYKE